MFRMLLSATLCVLTAAPLWADQAEDAFFDRFGARYEDAVKRNDARDKAELGREVYEAAGEIDDDATKLFFLKQAALLAEAHPKGYEVAIEARQALIDTGADRLEQLTALKNLWTRIYRSNRRYAAPLLDAELTLAEAQMKAGKLDEARTTLSTARRHIHRADSDRLEDRYDTLKDRLETERKLARREEELKEKLAETPEDEGLSLELARLLLFDRHRPTEAYAFYRKADDTAMAEFCRLFAKLKIEQLDGKNLLALGDRAAALARKERVEAHEAFLLDTAVLAYHIWLDEVAEDNPKRASIEKLEQDLWKKLQKLRGLAIENEKALLLNGEGYAVVAPSKSLKLNGPFTVELWMYAGELKKDKAVTLLYRPRGKDKEDFRAAMVILIKELKPRFSIRVEGSDDPISAKSEQPVPSKTWVHLAGVFDGKSARLYVNGHPAASEKAKPKPVDHHNTPLIIGAYGNRDASDTWDHFSGVIDEVRISEGERYKGAFRPQRRFAPDEDTLLLLHFDKDYRNHVKDGSGQNNHARLEKAKLVDVD